MVGASAPLASTVINPDRGPAFVCTSFSRPLLSLHHGQPSMFGAAIGTTLRGCLKPPRVYSTR